MSYLSFSSIWAPIGASIAARPWSQLGNGQSQFRQSLNSLRPMLWPQGSAMARVAQPLQNALQAPKTILSNLPPTPPSEEDSAQWLALNGAGGLVTPAAPPRFPVDIVSWMRAQADPVVPAAPMGPQAHFHLPADLLDADSSVPPRRTQLPWLYPAPIPVRQKLAPLFDLRIYGPHDDPRPGKLSLVFSEQARTFYLVGNPLFAGGNGKICPAMALSFTEPGQEDAPVLAFKKLHTNVKRSRTQRTTKAMIDMEIRATKVLGDLVDYIHDGSKHRTYIVTDWMPGEVYDQLLHLSGKERVGMTLRAAIVAAKDLQRLHARNIVHRDFKFDNMFCDARGFIKLGDPGLAADLGEDGLTKKAGEFTGTPHLMAPEVLRGERVSAAVDAWSLGMSIFEALAADDTPILAATSVASTTADKLMASIVACQDFEAWRAGLVVGEDAENHDIIDVSLIRSPSDPERTPWDVFLHEVAQAQPGLIAYVLSQLTNPVAERRNRMADAEHRLQKFLGVLGHAPQGFSTLRTSAEYDDLIRRMHDVRKELELKYRFPG